MGREGMMPALAGRSMPKKRPDKQQNQEEPPFSLRRDMPPPAPVDDEAFARRAGEIIANSSTSLHKPSAGSNKRPRRSG
jgi:hypothetical protein